MSGDLVPAGDVLDVGLSEGYELRIQREPMYGMGILTLYRVYEGDRVAAVRTVIGQNLMMLLEGKAMPQAHREATARQILGCLKQSLDAVPPTPAERRG